MKSNFCNDPRTFLTIKTKTESILIFLPLYPDVNTYYNKFHTILPQLYFVFCKQYFARKLKALKTHVVLLTWDPANTASTSRFLKEEVCTHIDMNSLINADTSLLQTLTFS